jgi:hypothetical protein
MKRLLQWIPRPGHGTWRQRLPSSRRIVGVVSIVALAALCYIAGAAAMYFQLPSTDFLAKAFAGAERWAVNAGPGADRQAMPPGAVVTDKPGKAYEGFTLVTTTLGPTATLLNMRGQVVHRWEMPFPRRLARTAPAEQPLPGDPVHWECCHIYPNGDLLALCAKGTGSPYGYGLAKFDKDSNLLWAFADNVHHDFDVGEDGRIYVLLHELAPTPPTNPAMGSVPSRAEFVAVLGPDGHRLDKVALLDAFQGTPYLQTLLSANGGLTPGGPLVLPGTAPPPLPFPGAPPGVAPPGPPNLPRPGLPSIEPGDALHTNSVRVLPTAIAPKFPLFKAGQVLLSLRTPSTLAVLDLPTRSVVWAARGIWQYQHDACFLDNGNILLFDNLGGPPGSRIVEYNPVRQAVPWCYTGNQTEAFTSMFRGRNQRLPNGNTLICSSDSNRVLEVSTAGEVVWQWASPDFAPPPKDAVGGAVVFTGAHRYAPHELTFLKETSHVQPR